MNLCPIIHKEDFYTSLFEQNKVSKGIDSVYFLDDREEIFTNKDKNPENPTLSILELVPDYLVLKLNKPLVLKKVFHKKGYGINVSGFSGADDYLKATGSANFRKNVMRGKNRLETCFNIRYTTFYGHIERGEYQMLMGALHTMITKRFQERLGRNKVLENWEYYFNTAYHLINTNKASLFVIYNVEEPIELSLNFHFKNIMYSAISSYNLEYSKFSLGNIEIFKQLEWCVSNNVVFFDMGYGDLDYKKRWANLIYNFETHIISKPFNKKALFYGKYLNLKYKTINYLISKKINNKIYHLKNHIIGKKEEAKIKEVEYKTDSVNFTSMDLNSYLNVTDQLHETLEFIKRPIYNFLYSNNVHINDITIYQHNKELSIYIVTSKTNQLKIEITK